MKISYLNYTARIQQQIISNILENEDITKLLYYNTKDALEQPSLTDGQRTSLLFGEENDDKGISKKIYTTKFNDDTISDVKSEIRISKSFIDDSNVLVKTLFFFEILVHSKIELMENGFNRSELILSNLLDCIKPITAIGKLDINNKDIFPVSFGKSFNGYVLVTQTRVLKK